MAFGLKSSRSPISDFDVSIDCAFIPTEGNFIETKIKALLKRIILSALKRTKYESKMKDDIEETFYGSADAGDQRKGLVSILADLIYANGSKILVFTENGALKYPTQEEKTQIEMDYMNDGKSSKGAIINFSGLFPIGLLKFYYSQLFYLNKSRAVGVNLSSALQIGIDSLRNTVGASNSEDPVAQAIAMATALKGGKAVMKDAKDTITTTDVNIEPIDSGMQSIYQEICETMGVTMYFVSGVATTGMSVTGDADINNESDCIKPYWQMIIKPIMKKLYRVEKVSYVSDRFREIESRARTASILESLEYLSEEKKRQFSESVIDE